MAGRQRGNFTHIIRRRDLDNIHSDYVDALQTTQYRHGLMRRQTTANGCSCTRRITGIETVDIECDVDRIFSEVFADFRDNGVDTDSVYPRCVNDVEPERVRVLGAQTNLY